MTTPLVDWRFYLNNICKSHGLTLTEIARRAGLAPSTLTRHKPGSKWNQPPNLETVRKVRRAFPNVPLPDSIMPQDNPSPVGTIECVQREFDASIGNFKTTLTDWQITSDKLAAVGVPRGFVARFDQTIVPVFEDIVLARVVGVQTLVVRLYIPPFLITAPAQGMSEIIAEGDAQILGTMVRLWRVRQAIAAA